MLSKRARGYDEVKVPVQKRLRENISDLFLSNSISASRAADLFHDAAAAGASSVADLARLAGGRQVQEGGSSSSSGPKRRNTNVYRDLMRKLTKRSPWPQPYYAQVRVWNRKTKQTQTASIPIMLPSELVKTLLGYGSKATLLATGGMSPPTVRHLQKASRQCANSI